MSALEAWFALRAPDLLGHVISRWSLRWYAIVAALIVPVALLRIADRRLRALR